MHHEDKSGFIRTFALVGSLGFTSAVCIIGGVLGGFYLDGLLGSKPVFLIVGTLAGVGGTCVLAYKWVMRYIS